MKALFIGLGGIGQRHLRNLIALRADAEIYAIRRRREQTVLDTKLQVIEGETLEEKYQIRILKTLEEAKEIGVDTVFICNPSSMHMDILIDSIKYGWNVFVEKPLSHNLDRIDDLKKCLKAPHKTTMIGFQNRFHPCIKKVKEILKQGIIGEICFVNAEIGENVTRWHPFEDYKRMYACRKELGGGVVLSQIHELDYLYHFLGMPQTIYAVGGTLGDLEIDVEDVADVLMTYRRGNKTIPVCIHEDYLQFPPNRKCKIQGTKGRIDFDLIHATVDLYNQNGELLSKDSFDFDRNDMFLEEMQNFLESIKMGQPSDIPVDEGIQSLEMAMHVKKSIETGNIIKMGELQ